MNRFDGFSYQKKRFVRRERANTLLSDTAWGAFAGFSAAVCYALLADMIKVPLHPLAFAGAVSVLGAAIGVAIAFLRPIDITKLLIRIDGKLKNGELSSTAHELIARGKESIFAEAIIEDAVDSLGKADPVKILERPRLPILPALPALLAAAVLLSVFPFDLVELLAPRPVPDAAMIGIGTDLEGIGKRLERRAEADDLDRSLRLAQELQSFGESLKDRRIDREDALDRISELESLLAQEYEFLMRLPEPRQEGSQGSLQSSEGNRDQSGEIGRGEELGNGDRSERIQGREDLADALNRLSQDKQRLKDMEEGKGGESQSADRSQSKIGTDEPKAGGNSPGESPTGGEGNEGRTTSGESSVPGTLPDTGGRGPATAIPETDSPQQSFNAQVGEGDTSRIIVRSLPGAGSTRAPASGELREYARTTESSLAREEIPPELKEYVKQYFISIGLMGNSDQGR
jgi:hypothetical protein